MASILPSKSFLCCLLVWNGHLFSARDGNNIEPVSACRVHHVRYPEILRPWIYKICLAFFALDLQQ